MTTPRTSIIPSFSQTMTSLLFSEKYTFLHILSTFSRLPGTCNSTRLSFRNWSGTRKAAFTSKRIASNLWHVHVRAGVRIPAKRSLFLRLVHAISADSEEVRGALVGREGNNDRGNQRIAVSPSRLIVSLYLTGLSCEQERALYVGKSEF